MSFTRTFRRAALGGLALCAPILALVTPASAAVVAKINQATQRMQVYVDGQLVHDWPVSTARRGYYTPNGSFRVGAMYEFWRSRKYHGSPMPHAMFFRGDYAIHGTYMVGQLGRRASHGCIRLHPANARTLFHLTRSNGGTRVVIQ